MATWPSPQECEGIIAAMKLGEDVAAHARTVAALAIEISEAVRAQGHAVDLGLVEAGALLHDIGRARTHGIDHASKGAAMLRDAGLPEPVCRIVERHTGGGIDAKEAARLGLPAKDYTPRTIEERIVCAADNLVDGSKRQRIEAELADLRAQDLDAAAAKVAALHQDLTRLAGRDLDAFC